MNWLERQTALQGVEAVIVQRIGLTPPSPEFRAAFLQVQQNVPSLLKKDKREGGRKFAGHDQIVERVMPIVNAAGLLLYEAESFLLPMLEGVGRTEYGLADAALYVWLVLQLPTGEGMFRRVEWPVLTHKGMKLDKAVAATDSYAVWIYGLRGLFGLARTDETPPIDARQDGRQEARPDRPARQGPASGPEPPPAVKALIKQVGAEQAREVVRNLGIRQFGAAQWPVVRQALQDYVQERQGVAETEPAATARADLLRQIEQIEAEVKKVAPSQFVEAPDEQSTIETLRGRLAMSKEKLDSIVERRRSQAEADAAFMEARLAIEDVSTVETTKHRHWWPSGTEFDKQQLNRVLLKDFPFGGYIPKMATATHEGRLAEYVDVVEYRD